MGVLSNSYNKQKPIMKVAFILCLVLAVAAASPLDRSQALALHALAELRVTQAAEQLAATGNAVVVPGGGVSQIGLRGPDGSLHGPSAICGPAGQSIQLGQ